MFTFRLFAVLIALACGGCQYSPWSSAETTGQTRLLGNFTESNEAEDDSANQDEAEVYSKVNDRTAESGTGLDSRSRAIEKRLGYR